MSLNEFFDIGVSRTLGAHTFQAEEIKAFAAKFDPQPFHMDEEAARDSVLGGLCASGWHTASMWMRFNALDRKTAVMNWKGDGPAPEFGPSPGFHNLKWLKPVYAGQTITFARTDLGHRPLASRPGWILLDVKGEAFSDGGVRVFEFENALLVRVAEEQA